MRTREKTIILGREIGTNNGWGRGDALAFAFHEFEPAENIDLPPGGLWVNFESGKLEYYDDNGEVAQSFDIIDVLARDGVKRV